MIRAYREEDLDAVIEIWLNASVQAHHFVPQEYWQSQVENMRSIYIPASEVYVYEADEGMLGFYALHEDALAAIFVSPNNQGQGIGKQLLHHAKAKRSLLTLCVYKANLASYQFYISQGFKVVSEQLDHHTKQQEYTMRFEHSIHK